MNTKNNHARTAVFIHLYHHELWPEIYSYIKNLNKFKFKLFISLTIDHHDHEVMRDKILSIYPDAEIGIYSNKGLDVGPFLLLLKRSYADKSGFDYVLKIHTKKSTNTNPELGDYVRKVCFSYLLGSKLRIKRNLKILGKEEVGMIGPLQFFSKFDTQDNNWDNVLRIKAQLGIEGGLVSIHNTMFWAKYHIFEKYFSDEIIDSLYSTMLPGWKFDETPSHALERVFGHMVESEGLIIVGLTDFKSELKKFKIVQYIRLNFPTLFRLLKSLRDIKRKLY